MFGKKNLKIHVELYLGGWFINTPSLNWLLCYFFFHVTSVAITLVQVFSCCLPNNEIPKVIGSFAAD